MHHLKLGLIGSTLIGVSATIMLPSSAQEIARQLDHPQGIAQRDVAVKAATELLAALPAAERKQAMFPYDSDERLNWNFVPMQRAGAPLANFTSEQHALLEPLLSSALSARGAATAWAIVDHESVLGTLENSRGVSNWRRRDPGLYYTTVFGTPSLGDDWSWRFEGHHLSVNVTHLAGQPQVVAPLFMGANPARVPSGPKAGLRLLAAEEDTARALIEMMSADRRALAVISKDAFDGVVTRNDPRVKALALEGLAAADMSPPEQAQLRKLLNTYAGRMSDAAARDQLERIERAGFGKLHFAWAGSAESGQPHYYRIHGPTVLIEYDNTQNDANHVHSVWRDLERDFGGDALRAHYTKHRHERSASNSHNHQRIAFRRCRPPGRPSGVRHEHDCASSEILSDAVATIVRADDIQAREDAPSKVE